MKALRAGLKKRGWVSASCMLIIAVMLLWSACDLGGDGIGGGVGVAGGGGTSFTPATGELDTSFDPGTGCESVSTGVMIRDIVVQDDGKILIAGDFLTYNDTDNSYFVRTNSDGTLDTGFVTGTGFNDSVSCLALQSDGKILVGGAFTSFNGTSANSIVRLNSNGSLDTGFNIGTGFSSTVTDMAVQPDGKILVVGAFTYYNSSISLYLARLDSTGTLDTAFCENQGTNGIINCLSLLDDGKFMIGGSFTEYRGAAVNRIARISSDGSLDSGFDTGTGADDTIQAIVSTGNGNIAVGGFFENFNGSSQNKLVCLKSDGSLVDGFDTGTGFPDYVMCLGVQPDGKLLVGGNFATYNGTACPGIVRLNSDYTLDTTFNSQAEIYAYVYSMTVQDDGKILIGGNFFTYNFVSRNGIARIK